MTVSLERRTSVLMKTQFPSPGGIVRQWHVVDAQDQVLGRLASKAGKIRLTGRKDQQKLYRRHTGYPGGLIEVDAVKMRATRPTKMVEQAIAGMLPKNKLGKQMYRKLKVYAGDKHPHQAQKPVELSLT